MISLRRGHPATVRATRIRQRRRRRMSTCRNMPRSTIERCSSGSWTGRSASTRRDSSAQTSVPLCPGLGRICTIAVVESIVASQRFVHRRGVGDHRCIRRSDAAQDLPVRPRSRERRRSHHLGGRRRGRRAPQRRPPPPRQAGRRRVPRGPTGKVAGGGAGRPSKRYPAVADAITDFPVRSDDLVLSLLGRTLARLPHDEAEDGRRGRRRIRPGDGRRAQATNWRPGIVRCDRRSRPSPTH